MKVKVAAAQMDCSKNEQENLQKALKLIQQASSKGAKIVCLPELFNTGYYPLEIMKTDGAHTRTKQILAKTAKSLNIYIIAGMPEKSGNTKYNSAFLFEPSGKLLGAYRKNKLFPGVPIPESECFRPGTTVKAFDTSLCRIGIFICYDLRFPQIARKLALQGAEVMFVPAAWPKPRISHWITLLKARAIEDQCYIVGANRCGKDDSVEMGGCSLICDPNGNELATLNENEEGVIVAEVDLEKVKKFREKLPVF